MYLEVGAGYAELCQETQELHSSKAKHFPIHTPPGFVKNVFPYVEVPNTIATE